MNNDTAELSPIAPYMAIGSPAIVHGIGARDHIARNLDTIEETIHAAVSITGINLPVRLTSPAQGARSPASPTRSSICRTHTAHENSPSASRARRPTDLPHSCGWMTPTSSFDAKPAGMSSPTAVR
ncbi:hypothetical protein [Streptomyces sp. NPDC014744]|uniref:hypothetical protein n=1 Tax=Streptomyces sp. NPDC014744 TaxID=3364903 RepID=UPI0036F7A1C1